MGTTALKNGIKVQYLYGKHTSGEIMGICNLNKAKLEVDSTVPLDHSIIFRVVTKIINIGLLVKGEMERNYKWMM